MRVFIGILTTQKYLDNTGNAGCNELHISTEFSTLRKSRAKCCPRIVQVNVSYKIASNRGALREDTTACTLILQNTIGDV